MEFTTQISQILSFCFLKILLPSSVNCFYIFMIRKTLEKNFPEAEVSYKRVEVVLGLR
jgi:hypothetical protein